MMEENCSPQEAEEGTVRKRTGYSFEGAPGNYFLAALFQAQESPSSAFSSLLTCAHIPSSIRTTHTPPSLAVMPTRHPLKHRLTTPVALTALLYAPTQPSSLRFFVMCRFVCTYVQILFLIVALLVCNRQTLNYILNVQFGLGLQLTGGVPALHP